MLVVIIGVASVIAMIAIVEGGQVWLVNSIERLGTNLLFVWKKRLTIEERRMFAGRMVSLRYGDVLAVRDRFPDLKVVPIVRVDVQIKAGDRDFSGAIDATSPEFNEIRNFRPQVGRFLTAADIEGWKRTVALGKTVAESLFGIQSPLGREVKIKDHRFTVIGVMEPKGEVYGTDYDEKVFIPVTTALRFFKGHDKIRNMIIHVPNRERMDEVSQQLHSYLVQRHDGVDDIRVRNQGEFLNAVDRTIWTFRIVLGGIASWPLS